MDIHAYFDPGRAEALWPRPAVCQRLTFVGGGLAAAAVACAVIVSVKTGGLGGGGGTLADGPASLAELLANSVSEELSRLPPPGLYSQHGSTM